METVDFDVELIFLPLAILFLLLLSAFFSGSETALTGASRARLHQMEQSGNHRASLVNRPRDQHFFSYFGDIGVAYATLVMTVLVLVFAEVLPKTIALRRTIPVALFVAPLLQPAIVLLSPIVMSINYIVDTTLSLMGIKGYDGDTDTLTDAAQDELRGAIELHSEDAGIIMHERYMLDTILDMDEVDLGEIMVHRKNVEMVDGAKPVREIIDQVLGSPYTRLPLWKDNPENIIGVVHAKDLLRALIPLDGDYEKLDFEAIAVEPWFVPETTTLRSQLNAFLDRKSHFALVVDEYGALMGLVTLEDILEEIVGEIADEHDLAVSDIRMLKDGRVVTKGDVTIRDLNRQLNWSLPDEEAATIAGLVIHEAQIIPDIGQAFLFHGYKFEVMRKEHNQITELRITPLEL